MDRSLDAFRSFLGIPTYRSVVSDGRAGQRVAAHWSCGCVASGLSFAKLTLAACRSHHAERSAERRISSLR